MVDDSEPSLSEALNQDSRPASDSPEDRPAGRLEAPLSGPLGVRSVALTGLLVLAVFYTLYFGRPFFLPLVLALLLNLILSPVVTSLTKLHIPASAAAGIVVLALLGALGGGAYLLVEPAGEWMEKAPQSMARIEDRLRELKEPVEKVSRATQEVEKLTDVEGDDGGGGRREVQQVQMEKESLSVALLRRASGVAAGLAVVLVLLYFLLASGNLFLRKLIRILPTLADKKRAVDIARQLQRDLSRYLGTVTLINIGLGVAVGVAMHFLELPNPMLWGTMATVLNFVPYLGAMVGVVVIAGVSLLTLDSVGQAAIPPLVYFSCTALEGYFVTPMILGRSLTLNPVMILLSLLLWGWLWGIVGAVLAVPMLAVFKILCDHIKGMQPLGEFLGR